MRVLAGLTLLLLAPLLATAEKPADGARVLLWADGAPEAQGERDVDRPGFTVHYPPEGKATGTGVIVNPGGGYSILASDHEGLQVARWLNSVGVTAFVLRYRVKPYAPAVALLDGQRSVRYVRSYAEDFGVAVDRIGMLGFSAGGHLASSVGTQFDAGNASAADPVEQASSRPDFLVLVYPAISGELFSAGMAGDYQATHTLVSDRTPPAFLVHTHEDGLVTPNHSILFYQALLEHKVPAEMHIYGYGDHGLGMAPGDPDLAEWAPTLARWMRRSGFLTAGKRTAVQGTVSVDGAPLFWGWVTLLPEDPNAPIARANCAFATRGKIVIDEAHGPVPGRHRVEVFSVCKDFTAPKSGGYSLDDVERYTAATPGGASPIVVDIQPGQPLDIAIVTK
ncbi:MAG: alpha/beta hydrolase [Candidatus Hydrogenedentes bacterium]|nr:alpha/beta hydrolase [Candidatus Hydrogenedentota bacterium]